MSFRTVFAFVICACAAHGETAQNESNEPCGIKASQNHYPWLASIEYQYKNRPEPTVECTGALINERHVISNAKCIQNGISFHSEAETLVRLGPYSTIAGRNCTDANRNECRVNGVIRISVERVIIHHEYMQLPISITYDIALIRLRKLIQYTEDIQPICLPSVDVTGTTATDRELYFTGLDELNPKINHQIPMTYFDTTKCKKVSNSPLITEDEICANVLEVTNACMLNGGLLMNNREDRYELVGLLTFSMNCVFPSRHTKFTNLFVYLDWIRSKIPEWTQQNSWSVDGNPVLTDRPCNGTSEISMLYEPGKPPGEDNVYSVFIDLELPVSSKLEMQFDSVATVTLSNYTAMTGRVTIQNDTFIITLYRPADKISFTVRGPPRGTVPYFKSIKINMEEYCKTPNVGCLDKHIAGYKDKATTPIKIPDGCGRRHVQHIQPITNGEVTKAGDWPWHVAINRLHRSSIQYICGGTLITKTMVLTAAHCTIVEGQTVAPETLSVILGKYNLIGGDSNFQEKEVHSVTVHEDFAKMDYLENDIALLKLKSEVIYNDYVQPACVWYSEAFERLPNTTVVGTVVGWGIDQLDPLSSQLKQTNIPIVSNATCLERNAALHGNGQFCAGWANGTSTCNGDSGGGFFVFIPDSADEESSDAQGAWYIKGIASTGHSIRNHVRCDLNQYAVFTDIDKYSDWINGTLIRAIFGF